MKSTILLAAWLQFSLAVLSQSPLQWTVRADRQSAGQYTLTAELRLEPRWHVYLKEDLATGIEKLSLQVSPSGVRPVGDWTLRTGRSQVIRDPLFGNQAFTVATGAFSLSLPLRVAGTVPDSARVRLRGFLANDTSFIPLEETIAVPLEGGVKMGDTRLSGMDLAHPAAPCGDRPQAGKGLLSIFLIGFGGGLLALLTPCIFPMIPVTVSFFTGRATSRARGIQNALLYGLLIFGIYTLASLPFHLVGNINPQLFNTISTNAGVNVGFFVIFILFALSFFGLFEIKLPPAIANAAGSRSGIFFMALTLVIVSFSCTGIILGSLLVNALSSGGNAWELTAGMAGFGAALALPFAIFALFPQWMKQLPRSGGWLGTVKVTLAFIELALAIKFLSNADLVEHWGLLKREVFIACWLLIALGLGLYLLGVFQPKIPIPRGLENADRVKLRRPRVHPFRLGLGVLVLVFAACLLPGLTHTRYANLRWLSGFPPPLSYSIYGKDNVRGKGLEPDVINDYDKALALAKAENKLLLIDFTGWACVNCRKMEEQVWTQPAIRDLIRDRFILVSLYVDDRSPAPQGGTIGEQWARFQATHFKQVTQPLYVILSPAERLMNHPVGYTPSATRYRDWLQCALNSFTHGAPR